MYIVGMKARLYNVNLLYLVFSEEKEGCVTPITVIDVLTAVNKEEHEKVVREWAEDVFGCWYSKYKQEIEKIVQDNF